MQMLVNVHKTITINMYLLLKQARHSTALLPPFKNPVANGTVGG